MLRWQSRRAFAEAFAPAQETVGRRGLRLCRVPRPAVPARHHADHPSLRQVFGFLRFARRSLALVRSPNKINRRKPYPHNKRAYRQRNKIERMFCRLKDARRIATRYDKCANNFLSAVCLVALIYFWLN
jgi:transposase